MTEHITVTDDGPVRIVRMNRPDKKNALTAAMYRAMTSALEEANTWDTIRCIVFAGVPGAFSAGNDIHDFLEVARAAPDAKTRPAGEFLPALAACAKPMVAAVSGLAVGIGTTMLLHCDHIVAASDARFATPFASLGLVPEAASSVLAPRLMGYQRAFALLVMGRPLDAAQAKDCGLVNTVVPSDQVDAEAMKAAREIAALPPGAVAVSRRMMRGAPDTLLPRLEEEAQIFKERLASPEARAAFEAFLSRKG